MIFLVADKGIRKRREVVYCLTIPTFPDKILENTLFLDFKIFFCWFKIWGEVGLYSRSMEKSIGDNDGFERQRKKKQKTKSTMQL